MQNIGDPRRKIKCCCRSSSSPAFLCISKNYFHPFQSPWNCSLSRGFKVELEMFLIKFFLRVRLIHTNCPVLHWKNKTWQRKSKLTLLKTLCECMCFQGSCSIVWVRSLGQPGRIRRMGVAAKSPRARGKRQIRGRHLRQMVTQGFSYNGHATGFDGWENCSKAKTTWCCISLQCTVSFLSVAVEYGSFLTCAPRVEEVTTIHSNLIQCDRYRYRYGRMIKFIDAHCHFYNRIQFRSSTIPWSLSHLNI